MQMKYKGLPPASRLSRWAAFCVCVYLAGITWVVFGQTLRDQFVNFDDNSYVYENWQVARGLSLQGIRWAFTHPVLYLWTPLVTISHMLDCQLYGLTPAGHHLTNVLLHIATAILLFLVLRQMTGALWRGAFVAAVFAIHPLRVESVAWVAERKDVLSGVFFMLTLGAYVRYARHPPSPGRYLAVMFLFVLGLLVKPMLVTLPCVLLLLDYWPLGRWTTAQGWGNLGRLLREKIPLFVISAVWCVVTLRVGRVPDPAPALFPLPLRIGNAAVSSITYLEQMFYPAGLAVLYPFPPDGQPLWKAALAVFLLIAITAAFFLRRAKQPFLLAGWLWYLGMLAPVLGILQMGRESHADRYTYLPQIGIYVLITWGVAELSASWRYRRQILGGLAAGVIVALTLCARAQASYWRDSESLWRRMLACTPGDPLVMPHLSLGLALLDKGMVDDAIAQFHKALAIETDAYPDPNSEADTHIDLGCALLDKGGTDAAIAEYNKAVAVDPGYAPGHFNLGYALLQKGKVDAAIAEFQRAIQITPDYPNALMDLGGALRAKGELDEAILEYRKALEMRPDYPEGNYDLANALLQKGEVKDAIFHFEKTLKADPLFVPALNNLAWVLASCSDRSLRDGPRAVELAGRANQITGGQQPDILRTLAAAYAEAGQTQSAAEAAREALRLAAVQGNTTLEDVLRKEIERYEAASTARVIAPPR